MLLLPLQAGQQPRGKVLCLPYFLHIARIPKKYINLYFIFIPLLDRRPRLRASPEESRWKTPKPEILSSLTAFEELQPGQEWLILHRL
jgi:hypothetical protein